MLTPENQDQNLIASTADQSLLGKRTASTSLLALGASHNSGSGSPSHKNSAGEDELLPNIPGAIRELEAARDLASHTLQKDFADVLLIVTGGTLCMVNTENGYAPARGLAERLKKYQSFYDRDFC
jgi:hypothetical protein